MEDHEVPDPSPWKPEGSPRRIATMGKAIEELTECAQAAARCLIQGIDECEPVTGKRNRDWLEQEVADAFAALTVMMDVLSLDGDRIEARLRKKYQYLSQWQNAVDD